MVYKELYDWDESKKKHRVIITVGILKRQSIYWGTPQWSVIITFTNDQFRKGDNNSIMCSLHQLNVFKVFVAIKLSAAFIKRKQLFVVFYEIKKMQFNYIWNSKGNYKRLSIL